MSPPFRAYAARKVMQVRVGINNVVLDELNHLVEDLSSFHETSSSSLRHVESLRISLDEDSMSEDNDEAEAAIQFKTEEVAEELEQLEASFPRVLSALVRRRDRDPSQVSSVSYASAEGSEVASVMPSGLQSPMAHDYSPWAIQQIWRLDEDAPRRMQSKPEKTRLRRRNSLEFRSGAEVTGKSCWRSLVMRPTSPQCIVWDVCCMLAIMHDMLMIPLLSAFPIDGRGPVLQSLEIASDIIWFLDIIFTFFRGFLDTRKGIVELRLDHIAMNYARGWLLADVSLIAIDIMSYVLVEDLLLLTLFRLVRNLRVFRLFKMTARLAVIKESVASVDHIERGPTGSIFLETSMVIIKQLVVIAFLCHFTGCAWYYIGTSMEGTTWVSFHRNYREDVMNTDAPWEYMYITSLHWSLTQFTPAAMDVVAVNPLERIFSVVVTMGGLIVFSFFLGTINQALAKLRYLTTQEVQQNQLIRRYLNENGISVGLATEILTFVKRRGQGKANIRLVSADMKILQALPRRIRDQLTEEVSMPTLLQHPLFKFLAGMSYYDMARQCHKGMKEVSVVHGEEIFQPSTPADRMFFITNGRLKYFWDFLPLDADDVVEEMRLAESTLWLNWEYRGRLNCEDQSAHFLVLDAPFFRKSMCRSELLEVLAMYARLFFDVITSRYEHEDEASDLFGNAGDLEEIVKQLQVAIQRTQEGAQKFTALGLKRGPDIVEVFDAWKEMWRSSARQRAREKRLLKRFWRYITGKAEANKEVVM